MEINKIYQGDALSVLKTFPDECVSCVMTSPPYWGLRDYGVEGQLGLEETFEEYITKLCNIFEEVKRVLRKDGTCWVNLGDTYYSISGGKFLNDNLGSKERNELKGLSKGNELKSGKELEQKNLCNIPARFSIEMQNRGWILRNVLIWHKPNCMPTSVRDRFTIDFEYLFFFVKNRKYFFEQQYEPYNENSDMEYRTGLRMGKQYKVKGPYTKNTPMTKMPPIGGKKQTEGNFNNTYSGNTPFYNPRGRNKRAVWKITTKPFSEAHFAVYPEELCETPIKAGCPGFVCNCNHYVCPKCHKEICSKDIKEVNNAI